MVIIDKLLDVKVLSVLARIFNIANFVFLFLDLANHKKIYFICMIYTLICQLILSHYAKKTESIEN